MVTVGAATAGGIPASREIQHVRKMAAARLKVAGFLSNRGLREKAEILDPRGDIVHSVASIPDSLLQIGFTGTSARRWEWRLGVE
jgi:hypothetical protein